ncbi:hypothetical protein V5O48_005513 [Marasmius crinis-equi]|uniref:Uncharacterized protein n=1 Tax=Marasmius crinis-equi TaxID=585013 RepID=A0ABR3FM55_9AGAR
MPLRTLFSKKTSSSSSIPTQRQSSATKSQASLQLHPSLTPESPTSAEYVDVASPLANVPSSPNGRSSLHPNHAYQAFPSSSPKKNGNSSVYPSIANSPSSTASASSSRLRLFGRKKDRSARSVKSTEEDTEPPLLPPPSLPRPSFAGAISDSDIPNLAPPKLGSALGGSASTRSLPNTNPGRPELRPLNTLPATNKSLLDDVEMTMSPTSIVTNTTNTSNGGEREKEKKKSLFSWSKSESKASGEKVKKGSGKRKGRENTSNGLTAEDSFNLKAFRHVQPSPSPSRSAVASPTTSPNPSAISPSPNTQSQSLYSVSQTSQQHLDNPNSSTSLLPPPPLNHPTARPRNGSTDSQAQRISVAAFREAQARRSLAGSPAFDGRVSPGPGMGPGMQSRSQVNLAAKRASRTFTSEDESSEEEEEEEDSDDEGAGLSRKRTVTGRSYSGAKSESGHGTRIQNDYFGQVKTKSEAGHGSGAINSAAANDSDSDEDNAPLATLLPPRRPGSALSSRSNSSLNGRIPPSSFTPPPQERARTLSTLSAYNPNPTPANPQSTSPQPSSASTYPASIHSQDSSASARRPAPLIDINMLTGPKRAPLQSGAGTSNTEKSKEGFTGGATLLSGGTGLKRSKSPEKQRSGASSPTFSMTSKIAPANTKFASPPRSPVGSVFGLGASSAIKGGRAVPKRQETAMSDVSSVTNASGGGPRRDMISERLKGVVQEKLTSPVSTAAPPIPAPVKAPTAQPSRSHLRAPAAVDDSDSDEEEEEEEEDDEDIYGAADGTIKGRQQPLRAPQPRVASRGQPDLQRNLSPSPAPSPSLSPAPTGQKASPSPSPNPSYQQQRTFSRSPDPQPLPPATSYPPQLSSQPFQNSRRPQPATIQPQSEPVFSEPDVDLADVLGGGIRLISFDNADSDGIVFPPSPEDLYGPEEPKLPLETAAQDQPTSPGRIAPIVVRERERTPAFSVTSRPRHKGGSASVSGVISLGSTMEQEKGGDSLTTAAISSSWKDTTVTTTTMAATGGRARSSSIGSLPLLSNSTTPTISTTNTKLQILPPPRSTSLQSPEATETVSSSPESSPVQPRTQPNKAKGRSLGFGINLLSGSKSTMGLASDASASGSSSVSGGSSVVDSQDSSPRRTRQQPPTEREKPRPSKHVRGASAGSASQISAMTARPQPPRTQARPPPSSASSSSSQMSRQQLQRPPAMPADLPPPMTRGSPTASSAGSSSGRAPVTPRDGSDLGVRGRKMNEHQPFEQKQWSGGASGLGLGHAKKKSVTIDKGEDVDRIVSGKGKEGVNEEIRRRDRRRSEAKAAIELGNVINGKGPLVADDDDEDLPIGGQYPNPTGRVNMMNPMMMMPPNSNFPAPFGWNQAGGFPTGGPQLQMPSPAQFMVPPPSDPAFFAAHQQAMMFAKQAYQMAVAQQAMAAAADEWERGSAIGFSSSQSMYGGFGGGATGSVYGGLGGGNGWSTGSVVFPGGGNRTSGYGFSGARSEYGGGGGGWGGGSVVGGSSYSPQERARTQSTMNPGNRIGYMNQRDSMMHNLPPPPPIPQQKTGPAGRSGGPPGGGGRNRTVSQPASPSPNRTARNGKVAPPSSWKTGN